VLRRGDSVSVLSNVCSHLSGPLNRGRLVSGHRDDPCVECPWHGSVFSLNTGEVVHGPATAPLPQFDTRVTDGLLEVQLQRAR
jgi:nitrite reductase/ring-hydroxylating ferredoxin subunit